MEANNDMFILKMSDEKEEAICKYISRIQKKLTEPDLEQDKAIKYLHNLSKLPISVKSLKATGIGKTINELKKKEGVVGKKASELVARWKDKFSSKNSEPHRKDIETIKNKETHTHTKTKEVRKQEEKSDRSIEKKPHKKAPDHWKDVSLNLLGGTSKKSKKKRKFNDKEASEQSNKKDRRSAPNGIPDTEKKKHVIPVRRDPSMPSLPDIQLPDIQRVYRPLRFSSSDLGQDSTSPKKRKAATDFALETDIVSRKSRTQVFSGRRSAGCGAVTSLYQLCMRILIDNMDALEDTGGVPFDILEPMLSKASPHQLMRLEEFNPYFTEDTGELWKLHCQKEFKGYEPDDMESYREMYMRMCTERAEKLQKIQSKITESQAKKDPARQAKLAYIAGPPKPSAQIRRKQMRYGTGDDKVRIVERQKPIKSQIENRHRDEADHTIPFSKIPKRDRCAPEPAQSRPDRPTRPEFAVKKTASKPMMKAAMKMMKQQRNRGTVKIIRK